MGIYPNYSKIRGIEIGGKQDIILYKQVSKTDFTNEDIKKAAYIYNNLKETDKQHIYIQVLVEVSSTHSLDLESNYMWWGVPDFSWIK